MLVSKLCTAWYRYRGYGKVIAPSGLTASESLPVFYERRVQLTPMSLEQPSFGCALAKLSGRTGRLVLSRKEPKRLLWWRFGRREVGTRCHGWLIGQLTSWRTIFMSLQLVNRWVIRCTDPRRPNESLRLAGEEVRSRGGSLSLSSASSHSTISAEVTFSIS